MTLLFILCLAAAIVAILRANDAKQIAERTEHAHRGLQAHLIEELAKLRTRLREIEKEDTLANSLPLKVEPIAPVEVVPAPIALPPEPPPPPPPLPLPATPRIEPQRIVPPPPPAPVPKPMPIAAKKPINMEQFVGAKLFAWLGGLTAFFCAIFFVKYSFENNLIPPEARVALGFLTGIGLVGAGMWLHRNERYTVLAQTFAATGVLVLYGITFAAHSLYHLSVFESPMVTFGMMSLITVAAFLMAARMEAQVVAVLGMLGGFLTPPLCSTGHDNPLGLFSYIALLNIGVMAIARHKGWLYLLPLAAGGTALMEIGWWAKFHHEGYYWGSKTWVLVAVFAGFPLLFAAGARAIAKRWENDLRPAMSAIWLAVVGMIMAFTFLGIESIAERPWVLYALVFGLHIGVAWLSWHQKRVGIALTLLGGATMAHLTAWTMMHLSDALLPHALGIYFLFGVIHTGMAILIQRKHGATPMAAWLPVLTLLLMMMPMIKLTIVSFFIWPALLLVNVMIIALAIFTRNALPVLASLLLTLLTMAIWLHKPVVQADPLLFLLLLGGFTVFFVLGSVFLLKRLPETKVNDPLLAQLPAISAALPFLLVIMASMRLQLAEPTLLFGFTMGLSLVLLAMGRRAAQPALALTAVMGSLAVQAVWHMRHFDGDHPGPALGWYLGFIALFTAYPLVFLRSWSEQTLPWIASCVASIGGAWLSYEAITRAQWNVPPGMIPAMFTIVPLASLFVLLRQPQSNARLTQLAWFGGTALLFITLIFPLQFDRDWLTVAWALESAALLWLFHRVPHIGLRHTALGLMLIACGRLFTGPAITGSYSMSADNLALIYLFSFGMVALALAAGARFARGPKLESDVIHLPSLFHVLLTITLFLLMNVQISHYFAAPGERVCAFELDGGNFARDMTYTIGWSVFAFALLVLGFAVKQRSVRLAGISLLGVALLKLFFHDLASVAGIYRIAALFVVAVLAFAASFLYQRFAQRDEP